jgi:hypothetical protein
VLDTFEGVIGEGQTFQPAATVTVEGRSIVLLLNPKV